MPAISVADAKARFAEVIDQAIAGEAVIITRRGRPVARVVAFDRPREPLDVAALRTFVKTLPYQDESAGDLIRRMRDEGY